jgi:hypothetical protein
MATKRALAANWAECPRCGRTRRVRRVRGAPVPVMVEHNRAEGVNMVYCTGSGKEPRQAPGITFRPA